MFIRQVFGGIIILAAFTAGVRTDAVWAVEPFSATCKEVATHSIVNFSKDAPEWSIREGPTHYPASPWTFIYTGGSSIIVDNRPFQVLEKSEKSLIAIDHGSNITATSAWMYAINLELGEIVASRVNSYEDVLGAGLIAGSVQFVCDFTR